MLIDAEDAVKIFFSNASFEMIFFEAIANAFDANATNIKINIDIADFHNPQEQFIISIEDNGDGFTDANFKNFCKTGKKKDKKHKGVGRVVYLKYFKKVEITSFYENANKRCFVYTSDFKDECSITPDASSKKSTTLVFSGFCESIIHAYSYLIPEELGKKIMEHFLLRLYDMQVNSVDFNISIQLNTEKENESQGFINGEYSITPKNLLPLKKANLPSEDLTIFTNNIDIYYSIQQGTAHHFVKTGIEIDGRIAQFDLIDEKMLPPGCQILFVARSEFFNTKIDMARNTPMLPDGDAKIIKRILRKGITKILESELPAFSSKRQAISANFSKKYPFLTGYFDFETIGLIDEHKSLSAAQNLFLLDQKSVLEASQLDDQLFEKSLTLSSRVLAQYILYRNLIIKKLQEMTPDNSEADIHNLIIPKKTIVEAGKSQELLYTNNIWLFDDKYMTFTTILSDEEMSDLTDKISEPQEIADKKRPDIAIVFSKDIKSEVPVDVVIVELKKKGASLDENVKVTTQLWQRAKKLLQYYPNKIQRIWFYGVVSIDDEFASYLRDNNWKELFSLGNCFYHEQQLSINQTNVPVGYFLLPYETLLADAAARNETFLNILKENINKQVTK